MARKAENPDESFDSDEYDEEDEEDDDQEYGSENENAGGSSSMPK